jgi:hypothetical protein
MTRLPLKVDQSNARCRIEFLLQMRGALRQHQLARGPHVSLQQVSAVRCTIAFAYHDMGMNLGLAIFQSHIAD